MGVNVLLESCTQAVVGIDRQDDLAGAQPAGGSPSLGMAITSSPSLRLPSSDY